MRFIAWAPCLGAGRDIVPRVGGVDPRTAPRGQNFPRRGARRFAPRRRRRYDLAMLSFLREFAAFLRAEKKYWLVPIVVVAGLIGILFLIAAVKPAVAPFLYSFI